MQDGELSLEQFRGKVVVLSFWASWCGPCRRELPALMELRRELGPEGLEVVGINLDAERGEGQVLARRLQLDFPLAWDADGRTTDPIYPSATIPVTVVVDREGRTRTRHEGYGPSSIRQLRSELKSILAETSK